METCDICSGSRVVKTTGRDGATNCVTTLEQPCTACEPVTINEEYEEYA